MRSARVTKVPASRAAIYTAAALLCVVLVVAATRALGQIVLPSGLSTTQDLRVHAVALSLVVLALLSYFVWPSRWNVVAHAQLAFALVAYVLPIYVLGHLDHVTGEAFDLYTRVLVLGAGCAVAGTLVGGLIGRSVSLQRLGALDAHLTAARGLDSRVQWTIGIAIAGVLAAFIGMGFAPALTPEPLVAKFFRGAYAEPYAPFAPLYRASTTIVTILLPLAAVLALRRRRARWLLLVGGALAVMLLGLLREPALSGILMAVGVVLAVQRRGAMMYVGMLVGAYFVGSGLYYLLAELGFQAFASTVSAGTDVLGQVAAGAPDVRDHMTFLTSWVLRPELTMGKTFVGGLVPGNFSWNPSVWSLQVVNPGSDIASIASGGLRLPAPVWGLVSFGWAGVVGVSAVHGFAAGWLAAVAQRLVPSPDVVRAMAWTVAYSAALDIFPVFFRLSYLSIIQAMIVVLVLFSSIRDSASLHGQRRSARPALRGVAR